jgi:hypothetical protein
MTALQASPGFAREPQLMDGAEVACILTEINRLPQPISAAPAQKPAEKPSCRHPPLVFAAVFTGNPLQLPYFLDAPAPPRTQNSPLLPDLQSVSGYFEGISSPTSFRVF